MIEKITFRIDEVLREDLYAVYEYFQREGLELDNSKVIRYLLTKGIEKMKLEGKLK